MSEENLSAPDTGTESQDSIQEKFVPQSSVDKIVGGAKKAAYEKGMKDAQNALHQAQLAQQSAQAPQPLESHYQPQGQTAPQAAPQAGASNFGGMQGQFTPEQLDQIRQTSLNAVNESQQKQANQALAQQIATDFKNKIAAASEKYPDIQEKMSTLDLSKMPHIVHLANMKDNTADIMYDLADNPHKVASLMVLQHTQQGSLPVAINKLSDSIKTNQSALADTKSAPDPLSQIMPSVTNTDNGSRSVRDFKKAAWLRG